MTNDRHAAEDITQEALTIAWSKIGQFDPDSNFTAWAAAIVRNVALNYRRKMARKKTVQAEDLDSNPAVKSHTADELLGPSGHVPSNQHHFDDRVMAALHSLNETARSCLLLRTIRELDYDTIARLLDIPSGTAMSHVYRARQAMRQSLDQDPGRPDKQEA